MNKTAVNMTAAMLKEKHALLYHSSKPAAGVGIEIQKKRDRMKLIYKLGRKKQLG